MGKQELRQHARRRVQEALDGRRRRQVERDRRHAARAVEVLEAIAEREAAVAAADLAAARAVQALVADGLELAEVAELCGGGVQARELARLAKVAVPVPAATVAGDA